MDLTVPKLPVSHCRRPDILTFGRGAPVWPICTPEEEQQLHELANVYGAALDVVTATLGRPALHCGRSAVVSIGGECAMAGRLYAHLTGRRHWPIGSPNEMPKRGSIAVAVCLANRLDASFLAWLKTAAPAESVVGLICAPTADELILQVLLRSAALRLGGRTAGTRIDILPLHNQDITQPPPLGDGQQDDSDAKSLDAGASVLSILTHADGVCAYLGRSVLCPIESKNLDAVGPEPRPRCIAVRSCFRCKTPIAGVHLHRVAARSVRARFVVLESCATVPLNDAVVDFSWSLLHSLCGRATIGGMTANVGVVQAHPENVRTLADNIHSGTRVGLALRHFLESDAMRQTGREMLLFGDPEMRVGPKQTNRLKRHRSTKERWQTSPTAITLAQLGMYRVILTLAHHNQDFRALAGKALASAIAYEFAAAHRPAKLESDAAAEGPMLRAALLDYFVRLPLFVSAWQSLADLDVAARKSACPHCGRQATTLRARFCLPGVARRRLSQCLHCGVFEDVPEPFSLRITTRVDSVVLSGSFPIGPGSGRLVVRSPDVEATISTDWPFSKKGAPIARLPLPPLPQGPVRVSAMLIVSGHALWAEARAKPVVKPDGMGHPADRAADA